MASQGSNACADWEQVLSSVSDDVPLVVVDSSGKPSQLGKSGDEGTEVLKIAVLDSSFNPPTLAHERLLRISETAEGLGPFNVSLLMLGKSNADKAIFGAQLHERMAMMSAMALAQQRDNSSCRTLLSVTQYSRFVDKARVLLEMLRESPEAPRSTIYFIVGSDTLIRIFNPKYYEDPKKELAELFRMAHLISFDRDEESIRKTAETMDTDLGQLFKDRITLLKVDDPRIQDISSTKVRQALADGNGLADLLLPGVEAFILDRGDLYRS